MCAMISGLFIGSNDGRPPQANKQNIVSLIFLIIKRKTFHVLPTSEASIQILINVGQPMFLESIVSMLSCVVVSKHIIRHHCRSDSRSKHFDITYA